VVRGVPAGFKLEEEIGIFAPQTAPAGNKFRENVR
jgi:hypothetical protein